MARVIKNRHDPHALTGLLLVSLSESVIEFGLWIVYCIGEGTEWGAYPYFVVLPTGLVSLWIVAEREE